MDAALFTTIDLAAIDSLDLVQVHASRPPRTIARRQYNNDVF